MTLIWMRPSCGTRFSAMLMLAMIFTRLMMADWRRLGGLSTSCSTPSMRYRTRNFRSSGSRWISEARLRKASRMIRLTSLMIGASDSVIVLVVADQRPRGLGQASPPIPR